MADTKDPTQGGTIDLRTMQGGQAAAATSSTDPNDPAQKFEIPETVRKQYPDLIPLILATESMNDEERQYWFQILPIMTDDQVSKLKEILLNEKQQLASLDKEYEQELKRINSKHVSEWKAYEAKEKREKLKKVEGESKQAEQQEGEDLLKKLQEL